MRIDKRVATLTASVSGVLIGGAAVGVLLLTGSTSPARPIPSGPVQPAAVVSTPAVVVTVTATVAPTSPSAQTETMTTTDAPAPEPSTPEPTQAPASDYVRPSTLAPGQINPCRPGVNGKVNDDPRCK